MSTVATLSNMFIFKNVDKSALQELCSLAPPVSFHTGVTIFEQADESDVALLLVEGKLGVEIYSASQRREIGQVNMGEIVGETALFAREGKRSASVRALEPSKCLLINQELLVNASKNEAVIAIEKHLLGTLARRIRRTNQETSKIWKEYSVHSPTAANSDSFISRLKNIFGGR